MPGNYVFETEDGQHVIVQAPTPQQAQAIFEGGGGRTVTPQDVMALAQQSLQQAQQANNVDLHTGRGSGRSGRMSAGGSAQMPSDVRSFVGARGTSFQGAHVSGPAVPSHRAPVPPPDPRSPGSYVAWVMGHAANAGLNAAQAITHREARPQLRFSNPAQDAVAGFVHGASTTLGNMVFSAIDPQSAGNSAQSLINHVLPVAIGTLNHQPGDQQSALIQQLEQQRLARGGYTAGERAAPMLSDYQPSTGAGQFATRAGAAAPTMVVPGGMLPTLLGFAGGEGAGAAAEMSGANPDQVDAARFGGNLLGATVAAPFTGARPSERVMRNATDNLDLAAPGGDLDLATALMRRSRNLPRTGIDIRGDEALSHVAGPRAAPLQTVVRQASRAPRGLRAAGAQMADRPMQVQEATQGTADLIAPPIQDSAALGARAQNAAAGALGATRSEINSVARPDYEALRGVQLPQAEFEALMQNPSFREALREVTTNPELRPLLQVGPNGEIPLNDLNTLNLVQTHLRTMAQNAREAPTNPRGSNTIAHMRDTAADQLDAAATTASRHWENARGIVSQGRAGVLSPEQAGPLGDIGGRPDAPAQANARGAAQSLYPSAANEGQANATVQALRAMEAQDTGVGADLTRLRLLNALEQGAPRLQGGNNPRAGANVANNLVGRPYAAETFRAGVQEVAPAAVPTVNDLLEALQATGMRAPEGSQTATDITGMSDLGAGELPMEAVRGAVSPHQLPGRWNNMLDRWQVNQNAGEIMRVLDLPPDEFAAYMRGLPSAGARNRGLGLVKALMAGQAVENQ